VRAVAAALAALALILALTGCDNDPYPPVRYPPDDRHIMAPLPAITPPAPVRYGTYTREAPRTPARTPSRARR
jgi:hypothetical protein